MSCSGSTAQGHFRGRCVYVSVWGRGVYKTLRQLGEFELELCLCAFLHSPFSLHTPTYMCARTNLWLIYPPCPPLPHPLVTLLQNLERFLRLSGLKGVHMSVYVSLILSSLGDEKVNPSYLHWDGLRTWIGIPIGSGEKHGSVWLAETGN